MYHPPTHKAPAADNSALAGQMRRMSGLTFENGFETRVGPKREHNEDAAWWMPAGGTDPGGGCLWAVADGIGGNGGGRMASHTACAHLRSYYKRLQSNKELCTAGTLSRYLVETIFIIDRRIRRLAAADPAWTHMGTTLTCLVLTATNSIIAHVGDSRIYRWRKGRWYCLTTDHTFVQDMIFEGEVDPCQAHRHPLRHMLTRAVGTAEPLSHVDTRIDRIQPGDRFLLCTDGLYATLGEDHMAAILSGPSNSRDTAMALVDKAISIGARDDMTALVVDVKESGAEFHWS